MQENGYVEVSGRLCMAHFKFLMAKYRRYKTLNRGGERWAYMPIFEEMYADDPRFNPPNLVEAGARYNRVGPYGRVSLNLIKITSLCTQQ